jgi:hypothetical protein
MILALFSAAIVFPFHPPYRAQKAEYSFEAHISSNTHGIMQLYYDVGRGFNEADSTSLYIGSGNIPKPFAFRVPFGRISALRFDPLDREGTITLTGARIRDGSGRTVVEFPPSAFRPAHQIRRMTASGPVLTIEVVPGGSDPNTRIALEKPLTLAAGPSSDWVGSATWFAAAYAGLSLLVAGISRLPWKWLARLLRVAAGRPVRTLGVTALVALLVNNHPVIFFGKSFVSPNNGVYLLYEAIPTLPGYSSTTVEDGKGSDVGAVMWWHIPVSRIQRHAIFADHELPLWNRYDLCGQTLLGQGQSMIGDPLHLATAVLGGGSAVAWDIKYLAAKWLFAFGIGLTVLLLTDRLLVAALLCASSLFIGFFGFRLNHPAFFSLCYSPWILYSWIRISRAPGLLGSLPWIAALLASEWTEINSGTVKEAYVMVVCLNGAGLLALLLNGDEVGLKARKAAAAMWFTFLFVLISAPLWLTFLDSLKSSFTVYDAPDAIQLPLSGLLGFFEDLFYRQANALETHVDPSTNFLVLVGVLWAVANAWRLRSNSEFRALSLAALLPLALVYGIVPKGVVVSVPFLGNIRHIDDVFSSVLITLAIPLAGFGLKAGMDSLREKTWLARFGAVTALLALLLCAYFGFYHRAFTSTFFRGYMPTLVAAALILQLSARRLAVGASDRAGAVLLVVLSLLAIHWRHSQYLETAFDPYVFNPQERADLRIDSPAIEAVKRGPEPVRVMGLRLNLFPGFNGMYLAEGIFGIDALRGREFEDLAVALGLGRVLAFTTSQAGEMSLSFRAAYDALNVGYLLGPADPEPYSVPGWKQVGDFDLMVYRSPTAWPRAFYADRIMSYVDLGQLAAQIRGASGLPLASVQESDLAGLPQLATLPGDPTGRRTVAASNYRLTNNVTSFRIDAPAAGVVVLSETWLKDDFLVTVNGRPADYFRVNHAFKGIYVDRAGTYEITFEYWPKNLTACLRIAALGLVLAGASFMAGFLMLGSGRKASGSHP